MECKRRSFLTCKIWRTLYRKIVATLKYYTERSSVNDSTGDEDAEQMVQTHESDFFTVIDVLKQGMSIAEEANDETTGVMLLDIH